MSDLYRSSEGCKHTDGNKETEGADPEIDLKDFLPNLLGKEMGKHLQGIFNTY